MTDSVHVLFDIGFLGRVEAGPRRTQLRAGICRVVENTVRAVSAEPSVRLTLTARSYHQSALAYVAQEEDLRVLRFPVPARKRLGWRVQARAVEEHRRARSGRTGALPVRIANRLVSDVNRAADTVAHTLDRSGFARADVFHSPFDPLPGAAERARGVRHVLTVYDLIPIVCPEVVSKDGGDVWLRNIVGSVGPDDHVLAISEHTRADLLNERPDLAPERVHVTYLAADAARFRPCLDPERIAAARRKYGLPEAPYVLAVGTLAPHKNIPHLLRAFADLVRAEPGDDLHLVLVGAEGWGYERILEEVDRLGPVSDRIHFTGYVDDEDLSPLYTGALMFVCPSYYEGFGLTPLEAMHCGAPVIAGNKTSLPEVVGNAALLVDPRDRDALAQAMLELSRDAALRAELSRRSLERAAQFTWARTAAQTAAAYHAAL